MPRLDATGPLGAGPRTGRSLGRCLAPSGGDTSARRVQGVTGGIGRGRAFVGITSGLALGAGACRGLFSCLSRRKGR